MSRELAIALLSVGLLVETVAFCMAITVGHYFRCYLKEAERRGLGCWCKSCKTWHWFYSTDSQGKIGRNREGLR